MDETPQQPADPFGAPPQPAMQPPAAPTLPTSPTLPPAAAVPPPPPPQMDPAQLLMAPPPGPLTEVMIEPEDPKRRKKGVLLGAGVGILAVIAVVVGVLLATGGSKADAFSLQASAKNAREADKVAFTLHTEAIGVAIDMDARVDNAAKLMAMSANMPTLSENGKIDMIMDIGKTTIYMDASSIPGAADAAPTKWISFDMSQVPGMQDSLGALTGNNPLDTASLLENASDVKDLGIEDLDGVKVKHYQVSVAIEDLLKAQPGLQQQVGDIADLPKTVDYDVWVTEDNQLRKLTFSLTALGSTIDTEMNITAVGDIEPITVPADDEVTDMTELVGSGA